MEILLKRKTSSAQQTALEAINRKIFFQGNFCHFISSQITALHTFLKTFIVVKLFTDNFATFYKRLQFLFQRNIN